MIKNVKSLILLVCMFASACHHSTQARNIPAIVTGSVLTTGGALFTYTVTMFHKSMSCTTMSSHFGFGTPPTKEEIKANKQLLLKQQLAGVATAVAGLCLLGYGISK